MQQRRVAVIGAGAAGLVSAREALREGLDVVIYEAADHVGGVWIYREDAEDDLLGQAPTKAIHGSLYASLRTNLPREVMAFRDYPFDPSRGDSRQFPAHERVREYLEDFARDYDLRRYIQFGTPVERVAPDGKGGWEVTAETTQPFDAVMICNGHYSRPLVPRLPGMKSFPGLLMHSHNYRSPDRFAGKRVIVFGSGASGMDLAQELSQQAAEVIWCATIFRDAPPASGRIAKRPGPVSFEPDGTVHLADGTTLAAIDAVLFCTGYQFEFPFLNEDLVQIDENWVHPLYLDLISPAHPTLAFIGLPFKIVPFPLFEMQARWFLRHVAGARNFPPQKKMEEAVAAREQELLAQGRARRHFHLLGADQFAYVNCLAAECGSNPLPEWFEPMVRKAEDQRKEFPENYRDMAVLPA